MRTIITLTACTMASITAVAQTRDIQFSEFDLPNGLHVILHEDHSLSLIHI